MKSLNVLSILLVGSAIQLALPNAHAQKARAEFEDQLVESSAFYNSGNYLPYGGGFGPGSYRSDAELTSPIKPQISGQSRRADQLNERMMTLDRDRTAQEANFDTISYRLRETLTDIQQWETDLAGVQKAGVDAHDLETRLANARAEKKTTQEALKTAKATLANTIADARKLEKEKNSEFGKSMGWSLADDAGSKATAAEHGFKCADGERQVRRQETGIYNWGCLDSKGYLSKQQYRFPKSDDATFNTTYERDGEKVKATVTNLKGGVLSEYQVDGKRTAYTAYNKGAKSYSCTVNNATTDFGGGMGKAESPSYPPMSIQFDYLEKQSIVPIAEGGKLPTDKIDQQISALTSSGIEIGRNRRIVYLDLRQKQDVYNKLVAQADRGVELESLKVAANDVETYRKAFETAQDELRENKMDQRELRRDRRTEWGKSMGWSLAPGAKISCGSGERAVQGVPNIDTVETACLNSKGQATKLRSDVIGKPDRSWEVQYDRSGENVKVTAKNLNGQLLGEKTVGAKEATVKIFAKGTEVSSCTTYGDASTRSAGGMGAATNR